MTLPPDDRWPRAGAFLGLALAVTSIMIRTSMLLPTAIAAKSVTPASLRLRRANRPSAAAEWGP
jgi:hypothetical protein